MSRDTKVLFLKYKKFLIPIGVVVGVFLLVFMVILPQIGSIFDKLKQIEAAKSEINMLEASVNTIQKTSDATLDENFNLVLKTLPAEKNVELIFSALSEAANVANSQLSDFSVRVGGVYGRAFQVPTTTGSPSIEVAAHIEAADSRSVNEFMKVLYETLPLSEITKVNINEGKGSYTINFFFKPVGTAKIAEQYDIKPLSQQDQNLLKQLKEWER